MASEKREFSVDASGLWTLDESAFGGSGKEPFDGMEILDQVATEFEVPNIAPMGPFPGRLI